MPTTVPTVVYLVAGILFILSLRGLSTQASAQRGNLLGIVGMVLAIAVSVVGLFGLEVGETTRSSHDVLILYAGALGFGALVGSFVAARVQMTAMPELVAVLHSFVGVAAVLVGIGTLMEAGSSIELAHYVEVQVGVFVGAVTFTGSVIAFGKLRGTIGSRPLLLPGRHILNLAFVGGSVALGIIGWGADPAHALHYLLGLTALASLLGAHLVMAIGGGDMPVVVSLLNSYSGWAAAAAGFMLSNDLLIVTGALVGSSGAILSAIMCRAMNRSIWNVVFGGFGAEPAAKAGGAAQAPAGKVRETNVPETAEMLRSARSVIVIPGYGMAVAQAQHPIREITDLLTSRGVKVRFAIHPVAGRLPGHMNVLLAEAGISYDLVKELDEINDDFGDTDVVMIIGANDIVNPAALEDRTSPIYGMPVLEAWKAARVVMLKRSMAAGYAGVDNPICYRDNTVMLFGDAKQTVLKLLAALQS
ncbi:MAG TPA: NAD(P)(+) transhydrogenase (Re/Si-specific) subunit beta [Polyangia bacterium]